MDWGVFPCYSVQQHRSLPAVPVRGRHSSVVTTEVVHGKTGPAPSGAVLFGPFSWAYKKKDEEKMRVGGRDKVFGPQEVSSKGCLSANRRLGQVGERRHFDKLSASNVKRRDESAEEW